VSEPAAPFDPARFRQVLGHFPTGVTVVTAVAGDSRVGVAIGSFFSVSLEPPLVGFCVGNNSQSWPTIREAGSFCVNILAADQEETCRVFASKESDKFAGIGYSAAPHTGAPLLQDVLGWIECDIDAVHEAGDHDIVVGKVLNLAVGREGDPLVFFRGGYANLAR